MTLGEWFQIFSPYNKTRDLAGLKKGIASGHLDEQDDEGMTALHFAVMGSWINGMCALLDAGANTELRHHRTGAAALYYAVVEKNEAAIRVLLEAGANIDAPNRWAVTPRSWGPELGLESLFVAIPEKPSGLPAPVIQDAEHLADHYHPRFKIPSRAERESLGVGQAVDLHVLGPKKWAVKVRVRQVVNDGARVIYTANLDPPDQETNLGAGTREVTFGPEHVASIYLKRPF